MKKINSFILSGICSAMLALSACANSPDPSEAYPNETQDQIFVKGENALKDHSYQEAIRRFEALDVQYPFGPHTETAQLHLIYAYYKNSDYASAEAAADRFIRIHPTNPHVDYAYFMRGLSNYYQNQGFFERLANVDYATRDLTQVKKSFNDFSDLTHKYPHSHYAPAAHQYMIYLRDVLARHQIEVARFYYDRGAYVAAADRAALVVKNYQGSPRVPEALVIMAKSYHQLHQTQLENETLNVIHYNYPGLVVTEDKALPKSVNVVVLPDASVPPPSDTAIAVGNGDVKPSGSYVLEAGSRNVFSEQNSFAQNGDRNRGRGTSLGDMMKSLNIDSKNLLSQIHTSPANSQQQAKLQSQSVPFKQNGER